MRNRQPWGGEKVNGQVDFWHALMEHEHISRQVSQDVLHVLPARLERVPHLGIPIEECGIARPRRSGIWSRVRISVDDDHVEPTSQGPLSSEQQVAYRLAVCRGFHCAQFRRDGISAGKVRWSGKLAVGVDHITKAEGFTLGGVEQTDIAELRVPSGQQKMGNKDNGMPAVLWSVCFSPFGVADCKPAGQSS